MTSLRVIRREVRFDASYTGRWGGPVEPSARPRLDDEADELALEDLARLSLAASRARRRRAAARRHRWTMAGLALEFAALAVLAVVGTPL